MISNWGVRARVMLAAALPTLALAVLMTTIYTSLRISDLDEALAGRGRAYARQLAAASEYAIRSGNRATLQKQSEALLDEEDVLAVGITGRNGEVLALAGHFSPDHPPLPDARPWQAEAVGTRTALRITEPITASALQLDDAFSRALLPPAPLDHGSVVIDLSLARVHSRRTELLWTGVGSMLLVLLGGLVLASVMSRGVSGPIRSIAGTVLRIGQGHLYERVPPGGGGSLRTLAEGVNEMAARLTDAHARMTREVEVATAELRARKDEAEQANRAKSRFLAAASHDLRQPLHALVLFVSELARQPLDGHSHQIVDRISASAEAMENLLDSLLDISRLDAGVLQPARQVFQPLPILERLLGSQSSVADTRGLRLRLHATPRWVDSDPLLFERIIANLLSNAIRYTAAGTIMVACRRRGQFLRVEVRDSGCGIAAQDQEVVFQEFVQLDNPERARAKGLGLGLAIVRRLADLLGHRLELRSALGRGSIFAIELPLAPPPPLLANVEEARALGDIEGVRIALVDDDPMAREAMHTLLAAWGCQVTADENAEELLARLSSGAPSPEILITDFRMRGTLDGIALIAHLRTDPRYAALPAILISGDTGPDTLARARSAGLQLLHKPVRPARLRALIHRLLSRPEAAASQTSNTPPPQQSVTIR